MRSTMSMPLGDFGKHREDVIEAGIVGKVDEDLRIARVVAAGGDAQRATGVRAIADLVTKEITRHPCTRSRPDCRPG